MKKLIFLLLFSSVIYAQESQTKTIEKYIAAHYKVNHFSGTVLVMKNNNVVFEKSYGLADKEWNIANTNDTKYRIGSITKQFTAACILQLQEQGKLLVTDKLSKYIPDYPKGDSITIHMLLTHTAGIKNYTDLPEFWQGIALLPATEDSIISIFKNKPLDFSPGTGWKYSNSGYFLLGYIIEKTSGEKYSQYLYQNILKKAGMSNSGVDRLDSILYHRARGYSKNNVGYINTAYLDMNSPFSAGALYSTVADLYKWDRALYSTSLISDKSKNLMYTPNKNNYGYGVVIDTFLQHYRIMHNGGINGFVSNITRFINDNICVVVLSNNESNSDGIATGISGILLGATVEAPYVHKPIMINPSLIDKYVGHYKDHANVEIQLFRKESKFYRGKAGADDIELIPESNNKFFYNDDSDRQIEFKVDAKGNVTKIWLISAGIKTNIQKI